MIESELEKKHKCELLYHMTRQKLEMCKLRKELGAISAMKDRAPISTTKSCGSTHQSPFFNDSHIAQDNKSGERAVFRGRDNNMHDSINNGGHTTQQLKALIMKGKIADLPGSPKLGPTTGLLSDDVE